MKVTIVLFLLAATDVSSHQTFSSANAPNDPSSWAITPDMVLTSDNRPASGLVADLLADLETKDKDGTPVSRHQLRSLLSRPEARMVYYDKVIRYATPLSLDIQKKEHEDFTKIFMKESYQRAGIAFLREQKAYLEQAEREYGVHRKDIVSILTWESGLGKFTGDFRLFNIFLGQILFLDQAQRWAVDSMVANGQGNPLDDPERREKERKRLEKRKKDAANSFVSLLRFAGLMNMDPLEIRGSWGGAIGYVQFMPYNLKYAVDADGNGVNLNTWPDAIYSVANYLRERGEYERNDKGRRRALMRYNPSKEYVDGVILLAESIWRRYQNGE